MYKSKASVNLGIDARSKTKNGTYPIVIRVCHNCKQWVVSLRLYATKDDFKKATSNRGKISDELRELREKMFEQKKKAETVLENLKSITKDSFNQAFLSEIDLTLLGTRVDIETQFNLMVKELYEDEKIRSAEWYHAALKSFMLYRGNMDLSQVDEEYLRKYHTYMTKAGRSRSTIKMYMEAMRRIMNIAIRKKLLNPKHYPFGVAGYTIGSSVKTKKALMPNQVKKLYEYVPINKGQEQAKDFWILSYLCHGANPIDLMKLRWMDISNNRITFERSKTSKTTKELRSITIYIQPEIQRIIDKYGNHRKNPKDYVFPLLNDLRMEKDIIKAVKDWRRLNNRVLNRLSPILGFDFLLSLSHARHSFGTALKIKGTPVAIISDMLGHTTTQTTEHYLSSIQDDSIRDITKDLLDFKVLKAV